LLFVAQAEEKAIQAYIDRISELQKKIDAINQQQVFFIANRLSDDPTMLQKALDDQQVILSFPVFY